MPGFTHLQTAQPVTFGHHLMAYVEMISRDRGRFADARKRLNESPLGSAALAGTSFPIDRAMTAKALGFDRPTANSLDAVSDRDFVIETLAAASLCAVHLSRFAEEIVIWSSAGFGFIRLSDRFTTGSSIMPQKRNPDAAELVRAKSGRIIGALIALLIVLKGLPLAYQKDMQEDKEQAFDALDSLALAIAATAGMVRDMTPDKAAMRKAAGAAFSTATDLADWLVQSLGLTFRQAHEVTGRIVRIAEERRVPIHRLSLAELRSVEPRISEAVFGVLGVSRSVASRTSHGGTAPQNVRREARRWLTRLAKESVEISRRLRKPVLAAGVDDLCRHRAGRRGGDVDPVDVLDLGREPLGEGIVALAELLEGAGGIVTLERDDDEIAHRRLLVEGPLADAEPLSARGEVGLFRPVERTDEGFELLGLVGENRNRDCKERHGLPPLAVFSWPPQTRAYTRSASSAANSGVRRRRATNVRR